MGSLARGLAQELMRGVEEAIDGANGDEPLDEDMSTGGEGPVSSHVVRSGTKAEIQDKVREKLRKVEEEAVAMQEGEKVIEEVGTREATAAVDGARFVVVNCALSISEYKHKC